MIFYATVLRALAAILITNAHYTGVYPTDLIANGGLLGDVLFFSVSGFVLANLHDKFFCWYEKRITRIYPAVWVVTAIYLLLNLYSLDDFSLLQYFLYPTYYHFISSIILLYVPYYLIIKNEFLSKKIIWVMTIVFFIQVIIYVFAYDRSYYHIDTVREPMIRFLFFESMLLGAYFRKNNDRFLNDNKRYNWLILAVAIVVYAISKLAFVRFPELSSYQLVNQIVLFITLAYIMRCFAGIDGWLDALPKKLKAVFSFVSMITLEIYVVQYVIIRKLAFMVFPLNWIIITSMIILSAFLLHLTASRVGQGIDKVITKVFTVTARKAHKA